MKHELSGILRNCKDKNRVSNDDLRCLIEQWPWLLSNALYAKEYCERHVMTWNDFIAFIEIKKTHLCEVCGRVIYWNGNNWRHINGKYRHPITNKKP